jgi:hypothetical protein
MICKEILTHSCTFQLGKKGMVVFFRQMGVQRHGGWFHEGEYYNFLFAQAAPWHWECPNN